MKKLVLSAWVIILFIFSGQSADACSCAQMVGTAYDELQSRDAVFIGQVIDEKKIVNPLDENSRLQEVTLIIKRVWHGVKGKTLVLRTNISDCDLLFEKGKKYLIYAYYHSIDKQNLWTDGCARTKELKYASQDLKEFKKGAEPLKLPDVQPIVRPSIPLK